MMLNLDIWNDLLAQDLSDINVQKEIISLLKRFNTSGITKNITMRLNIWNDPLYDHFIISLCQLIEQQKGNGYNLMLLKSPEPLQQNRQLLWTLLK